MTVFGPIAISNWLNLYISAGLASCRPYLTSSILGAKNILTKLCRIHKMRTDQGYEKKCMCLRYLHVARTRLILGPGYENWAVVAWLWICVCVCVLVCVCISCLALPLAAYSLILKRIRLPLLELWPKRTSHSHWLASCILKLAVPLALASAAGHLPMRCGGGESVSGQ